MASIDDWPNVRYLSFLRYCISASDVSSRRLPHLKGWARPMQIAQWTFASAPYHPILIDTVSRVVEVTRRARAWSDEREGRLETLRAAGEAGEAEQEARHPVFDNLGNDGQFGILDWTGPGVFTDAVFRYAYCSRHLSAFRRQRTNRSIDVFQVSPCAIQLYVVGRAGHRGSASGRGRRHPPYDGL